MKRRTFVKMMVGAAAVTLAGGWRILKAMSPGRFVRAGVAAWPGRTIRVDKEGMRRPGRWSG